MFSVVHLFTCSLVHEYLCVFFVMFLFFLYRWGRRILPEWYSSTTRADRSRPQTTSTSGWSRAWRSECSHVVSRHIWESFYCGLLTTCRNARATAPVACFRSAANRSQNTDEKESSRVRKEIGFFPPDKQAFLLPKHNPPPNPIAAHYHPPNIYWRLVVRALSHGGAD